MEEIKSFREFLEEKEKEFINGREKNDVNEMGKSFFELLGFVKVMIDDRERGKK